MDNALISIKSESKSNDTAVNCEALTNKVVGKLAAENGCEGTQVVGVAEFASRYSKLFYKVRDLFIVTCTIGSRHRVEVVLNPGGVEHAWQDIVDHHIMLCHGFGNCDGIVNQGSSRGAG